MWIIIIVFIHMTVNQQKQIVTATTLSKAAMLHLLLIIAEVDVRQKIPLKMCTCSNKETQIEGVRVRMGLKAKEKIMKMLFKEIQM